jgi:carbamoyltransferase
MKPNMNPHALLRETTHRMVIRYHEELGHSYVPNLKARVPFPEGSYIVRTNRMGFRSDREFESKKGDRPRIVTLGDSFTAGDGVRNDQRFSEIAAEKLGAEVFNFGLAGSGTDQQVLIFEKYAKGIECDLVVLNVWVENIRRNIVSGRPTMDRITGKTVMAPKPYFDLADGELNLCNVPVPLERPEVEERQEESGLRGLVRMARKAVKDGLSPLESVMGRPLRESFPEYEDPDGYPWQLMKALIQRLHRSCGDTPLLVVPIPTNKHHGYRNSLPPFQERFDELRDNSNGLHVANLMDDLTGLSKEELENLFFKQDPHFSVSGNQVVGGWLAAAIGRTNLVKSDVPEKPAKQTGSKSNYILGVSCFYHNSAACLIRDGQIVAAGEEERFTRQKNDKRFPHCAVNFCLEEGSIDVSELDAVVYYDHTALTLERILKTQVQLREAGRSGWCEFLRPWLQTKLRLPQLIRRNMNYDGLILHDFHHRSHAASAFYASPYEEAAILTIDGVGEWSTATIGRGKSDKIELMKEMRFPHSVGLLYSAFTQFTGFKVNSGEYKMMGLSPYGRPTYVDAIKEHIVKIQDDGSIIMNMDFFAFLEEPNMCSRRFDEVFDGPPRDPAGMITQRERDIARSIQVVIEEIVLKMAATAKELTGCNRLCLAGGVALNCVANGILLREGVFDEIWIQPAAGDSGCALGAALDAYHNYFKKPRDASKIPAETGLQGASFLGPEFSDDEIDGFLETFGFPAHPMTKEERGQLIAKLLEEGKVVGHLCDRMEFGPRALGSRSILGDARNEETQIILNKKIKYRESFRPFAPAVLRERVSDFFELDRESPYMLLVAMVQEARRQPFELTDEQDLLQIVRKPRSDVPAITHVDYSARVQTVERETSPDYHALIKAFEERTGYGVVVNTSFNVRGEPIVCTPFDAYRCFMRTEMDVLVLGDRILYKGEQPEWPEEKGAIEDDIVVERTDRDDEMHDLLDRLFDELLVPALSDLPADVGGLEMSPSSSTWSDVDATVNQREVFDLGEGWDQEQPDHEATTQSFLKWWADDAATKALKGTVTGLLTSASEQRWLDESESDEVSDSMYVMY